MNTHIASLSLFSYFGILFNDRNLDRWLIKSIQNNPVNRYSSTYCIYILTRCIHTWGISFSNCITEDAIGLRLKGKETDVNKFHFCQWTLCTNYVVRSQFEICLVYCIKALYLFLQWKIVRYFFLSIIDSWRHLHLKCELLCDRDEYNEKLMCHSH